MPRVQLERGLSHPAFISPLLGCPPACRARAGGLSPFRLLTCSCGIACSRDRKWEVLGNAHQEDPTDGFGRGDRAGVLAPAGVASRDAVEPGLAAWNGQSRPDRQGQEEDQEGWQEEERQEEEGQ